MAFPAHVKADCLLDYLNTSKTLAEIAKSHGVSLPCLLLWHQKGRWTDKRHLMHKDIEERTVVECRRAKVMNRHLNVGGKIEDMIEKTLDDNKKANKNTHPRDLADLGKALKSSGDVSGRVVGLDSRQAEEKSQINFLINTNFTPYVAGPKPVAIDVQSSEDEEDPF